MDVRSTVATLSYSDRVTIATNWMLLLLLATMGSQTYSNAIGRLLTLATSATTIDVTAASTVKAVHCPSCEPMH